MTIVEYFDPRNGEHLTAWRKFEAEYPENPHGAWRNLAASFGLSIDDDWPVALPLPAAPNQAWAYQAPTPQTTATASTIIGQSQRWGGGDPVAGTSSSGFLPTACLRLNGFMSTADRSTSVGFIVSDSPSNTSFPPR